MSHGATGTSGGIYEVGPDGTGKRSRDAHFDAWEHALDSGTAIVEKTWGQVKAQQLNHIITNHGGDA